MAKKSNSINSTYIHNINDLVKLADINFLVCKKIYSEVLTVDKNHPAYDFLLLTANNAFNEAVVILHTLLLSNKDEEVRIKPALEEAIESEKGKVIPVEGKIVAEFMNRVTADYPILDFCAYDFLGELNTRGDVMANIRANKRLTGLKDFELIRKKFESYNFHKIRHQTVAHRNKHVVAPAGSARLLLKDDLINKLEELMKEVNILCSLWFNYSTKNHNYPTLTALDKVIKLK